MLHGGFRRLTVWQRSMELLVEIYRITKLLPKSELYGLSAQMRRAAVSIPSNIAEGYSREHRGDYIRFLSIAKGSSGEIETQIEALERLELLTHQQLARAASLESEVGRMLRQLIASLNG